MLLHNGMTFNDIFHHNETVSSLSQKSKTVVELLFAGYSLPFLFQFHRCEIYHLYVNRKENMHIRKEKAVFNNGKITN